MKKATNGKTGRHHDLANQRHFSWDRSDGEPAHAEDDRIDHVIAADVRQTSEDPPGEHRQQEGPQ